MKKGGFKKEIKNWLRVKKAIATEFLPWMIIALIVLTIVLVAIFLMKEQGISFIDKIKNIFRGR